MAFCLNGLVSRSEIVYAADGRLAIDSQNTRVEVEGHELPEVTFVQHMIIGALAMQIDVVHSKRQLSRTVWGRSTKRHHSNLKTQIARMRKSLGHELGNPVNGAIRTRHAIGYYLVSSLKSDAELLGPENLRYTASGGRLEIDWAKAEARIDGQPTKRLSPLEFNVLDLLASQSGKTVSHNDLYLEAWEKESLLGMETLKVTIANIRRKLGPVNGDPVSGLLRNERNVGYYIVEPSDQDI